MSDSEIRRNLGHLVVYTGVNAIKSTRRAL